VPGKVKQMIEAPFDYESGLSANDFRKIGELSLRWSHTEHVIANCLKVMLRLSDSEAKLVVFPWSMDQRLSRLKELSEVVSISGEAKVALNELVAVGKGVQYVRNNVVHAIVSKQENGDHIFHLRSKQRSLTKEQVFSSEELTNYFAHAALSLRYALGLKGAPGQRHLLPSRPAIPKFLQQLIPSGPKARTTRRRRSR
jgi:hypothetical protein